MGDLGKAGMTVGMSHDIEQASCIGLIEVRFRL